MTFADVLSIGIGDLQLKPWELDEYSLNEVMIAYRGFIRKGETDWWYARMIAFHSVQAHLDKKDQKIEKWMPHPWDKKPKSGRKRFFNMTPEERKAEWKRIQELSQHMFNAN